MKLKINNITEEQTKKLQEEFLNDKSPGTIFIYEPPLINHPEFLQKIDWKLLREQKECLLYHLTKREHDIRKIELFEGIIQLIDTIQDYASEEMGLGDEIVFNLNPEEE